jgi:hypothetical protein
MSYFDPTTWRAFTNEETVAYLEERRTDKGGKKRRKKKGWKQSVLVLQDTVSPFDAYTYLHARFGAPNGILTLLAKDDSDNLFHWDYYLKVGKNDLQFVGASEEVHVWFDGDFSDADCLQFIANLKSHFGQIGRDKGRFASTLEKWSIFPNQYLTIANRCADLYDTIADALPRIDKKILADKLTTQNLISEKKRKSHSKLMTAITTAPTELSVLMPVMFESFIGLIVAGLIRPEVKRNQEAFEAFVRSPLNQKLTNMAEMCRGFERPIEQDNPAFGRYWSVVNKRNDILHGNVDPVRDALEVVYFHGKRPLYKSGGDRIRQHWARLIDQYKPREVTDDYIATHAFIIEILNHLTPATRESVRAVLEDTQPGWDNKRKILGRLFPSYVATTAFPGFRYDWQLRVER